MRGDMVEAGDLLLDDLEGLLRQIDEFSAGGNQKPDDIPQCLERYLQFVAKSGNIVFPWHHVRLLFRSKILQAMEQFPGEMCPNTEAFVMERFDMFRAAPFTIQRLTELITQPTRHYKKKEKFLRGLEKTVLVVSTIEPWSLDGDVRNGNDSGSDGEIDMDQTFSEWEATAPVGVSEWGATATVQISEVEATVQVFGGEAPAIVQVPEGEATVQVSEAYEIEATPTVEVYKVSEMEATVEVSKSEMQATATVEISEMEATPTVEVSEMEASAAAQVFEGVVTVDVSEMEATATVVVFETEATATVDISERGAAVVVSKVSEMEATTAAVEFSEGGTKAAVEFSEMEATVQIPLAASIEEGPVIESPALIEVPVSNPDAPAIASEETTTPENIALETIQTPESENSS